MNGKVGVEHNTDTTPTATHNDTLQITGGTEWVQVPPVPEKQREVKDMGKAKTKVKEEVKDRVEAPVEEMEEPTPEVPEMEVSEEEREEFQNTYVVQRYDPENLKEFGKASAIKLYEAFYVPYYFDSEAQVEFRNGDMILTAIDPSKIIAGIVKHDTVAVNNVSFGVPDYTVGRIISVKATHIKIKGTEEPYQMEIEGSIRVGTDNIKNISIVSPIIEITDTFIQNLTELPKKFEERVTLTVEMKPKEFAKIIKELAGKIQTGVSVYFVAVDGTIALVEEGTEGIIVAELTKDVGITENKVLGKYALDYLKIIADILAKISVDTVEIKFTGDKAPLWIHGVQGGFFSIDLFLAPQIDEYDEEYYVALVRAVL